MGETSSAPTAVDHLRQGLRRTRHVRRCGGEAGAALVELAIALPVLLALLFGIYEFGRGYHAKVELTGAVREMARAVALGQPLPALADVAPGLKDPPVVTVLKTCPSPAPANANAEVLAEWNWTYNLYFFQDSQMLSAKGVMRCGL